MAMLGLIHVKSVFVLKVPTICRLYVCHNLTAGDSSMPLQNSAEWKSKEAVLFHPNFFICSVLATSKQQVLQYY